MKRITSKRITSRGIGNFIIIGLLSLTVACSMSRKKEEAKHASEQETAAMAAAAASAAASASTDDSDANAGGKASDEHYAMMSSTSAHDGHAAAGKGTKQDLAVPSHRKIGPVPPDKSLSWLINGNTRYTKGFFRNDGMMSKDRKRLTRGQSPHAVVLSCADSRVPPEILFDQKLGEIFVVRAAGEALDASTIGSVEYAVEHLGSNLLVVMGHESCGAVKAAFETNEGDPGLTPNLDRLLSDIRPRISKFKGRAPTHNFVSESWANVLGVAKDLLNRSKVIRSAVASGDLVIKPALYHMDSGRVDWK